MKLVLLTLPFKHFLSNLQASNTGRNDLKALT